MLNFWKHRRTPQRASARRAPDSLRHAKFEVLESRQMLTTFSGDFNGDGASDQAIGVPGLGFGTATNAGAVSVIYGKTQTGLATPGNQLWNMSRLGMIGGLQKDDAYGSAIAVGDFNGDGYADMAVGMPGRYVIVPFGTPGSTASVINGIRVGVFTSVGAVSVIYGSINGLLSNDSQFFTQTSLFPLSTLNQGSKFGYSLNSGDFDGDGFIDLAISEPFLNMSTLTTTVLHAGATYVLYGSSSGLLSGSAQIFIQGSGGILGNATTNAAFGQALESGDFNADGYADLAIGSPSYPVTGSVNVIYGSAGGLTSTGNQFWMQLKNGLRLTGSRFGFSMASGDFNGDFVSDLAIGAPSGAGAVDILFGVLGDGLTSQNAQYLTETTFGLTATNGDEFGYSLAAGHFNGDTYDDLAIGAPGADISGQINAGLVQIAYGTQTGIVRTNTFTLAQTGTTKNYNFGSSVVAADYNADGYLDISVGVPHQNFGTILNVGAVQTYYGSTTGITKKNLQLWRFGLLGLQGTASANTLFGFAMG